MELFVIRHGQSVNNLLGDESERIYDPPLTDLGKRQAEQLAQFLAAGDPDAGSTPITHLYCSAMHRALQTAAPLAKALHLRPEVWLDIHEQGGMYLDQEGRTVGFPGRTRAEILDEFPDYILPETVTETGWYDVAQGFEELHIGAGRAIKVALELRRRAEDEFKNARIAIITHGTFINLMLKAFLGMLPNREFYFNHSNTGVTRIDFTAEHLLVRYINRIDHLPDDMIS